MNDNIASFQGFKSNVAPAQVVCLQGMKKDRHLKLILCLILIEGMILPFVMAGGELFMEKKGYLTALTEIISSKPDVGFVLYFSIFRLIFSSAPSLFLFTEISSRFNIRSVLFLAMLNVFSNLLTLGTCYIVLVGDLSLGRYIFLVEIIAISFASPFVLITLPSTRRYVQEFLNVHRELK